MKEAPKGIDLPIEGSQPLSDQEIQSGKAAMYALDNDNQSYLVVRERKNRKLWRTFSYDIASFVPRDALHGGEDKWLIEKDIPMSFDLRVHVNAKNAAEYAGNSVKARKESFEAKAERKRKRLERGGWRILWRRRQ